MLAAIRSFGNVYNKKPRERDRIESKRLLPQTYSPRLDGLCRSTPAFYIHEHTLTSSTIGFSTFIFPPSAYGSCLDPPTTHQHKTANTPTSTNLISDLIDSHRIRRIHKTGRGPLFAILRTESVRRMQHLHQFLHHDFGGGQQQPRHYESSCIRIGFTQPPPPLPVMCVDHLQRKHWQASSNGGIRPSIQIKYKKKRPRSPCSFDS